MLKKLNKKRLGPKKKGLTEQTPIYNPKINLE
jgi:hypothetical protein